MTKIHGYSLHKYILCNVWIDLATTSSPCRWFPGGSPVLKQLPAQEKNQICLWPHVFRDLADPFLSFSMFFQVYKLIPTLKCAFCLGSSITCFQVSLCSPAPKPPTETSGVLPVAAPAARNSRFCEFRCQRSKVPTRRPPARRRTAARGGTSRAMLRGEASGQELSR